MRGFSLKGHQDAETITPAAARGSLVVLAFWNSSYGLGAARRQAQANRRLVAHRQRPVEGYAAARSRLRSVIVCSL